MSKPVGTFQFKIKTYDHEEGEYSAWQQAEPGTIIQFVLNHWLNETLPNNLDIIIIKNEKGDQLVIDHENKDVFRFFLIPAEKVDFYHYKMTDIRFMFFTLEHFFSGLLDTLRENMNKTSDDWRWVKGDFIYKDFHFKITRWRLIRHFANTVGLAIVLLFFFSLAFVASVYFLWFPLLVIIAVSAIYIRRHIWKMQWYLDQRFLEVQLSKGDRELHVWLHGQKKSIPKSDIISIQQHLAEVSDDGDSWWEPFYTILEFQNGDILNLHKMLIPQDLVKDKFFQEQHIFQQLNSNKKKIQKPTKLSGYFPDAQNKRYMR